MDVCSTHSDNNNGVTYLDSPMQLSERHCYHSGFTLPVNETLHIV
jgi:hypothetical protein